jgi:hypothetical protein
MFEEEVKEILYSVDERLIKQVTLLAKKTALSCLPDRVELKRYPKGIDEQRGTDYWSGHNDAISQAEQAIKERFE